MGSKIEINNTLKISKERGFPAGLNREDHVKNFGSSARFVGQEFEFWNRYERLYHHPPTRVFLVEETLDGKWLCWGHAKILNQTIEEGKNNWAL